MFAIAKLIAIGMESSVLSLSDRIVSRLLDGRYDEARQLLSEAKLSVQDEMPRELVKLKEALCAKADELGTGVAATRKTLACCFILADILREQEEWDRAEVVYDEVVTRSLAANETFFLVNAMMCRALCLKRLGRKRELEAIKKQIRAGTTILLDGGMLRVDDL